MPVLTPTQAAHAVATLTVTDFINTALHAHRLQADTERLWLTFWDAPPLSDEANAAYSAWLTAHATAKAAFDFLDATWAELAPNIEYMAGRIDGQAVQVRRKPGTGVTVEMIEVAA